MSKAAGTDCAAALPGEEGVLAEGRGGSGATPTLSRAATRRSGRYYGDGLLCKALMAAMPGRKSEVGCALDAPIERTVLGVRKAAAVPEPGCSTGPRRDLVPRHPLPFTKYIKVAFFRGASLHPAPSRRRPSREDVRYLDIREDEPLDDAQLAAWVKQASQLPGRKDVSGVNMKRLEERSWE